MPELHYIIGDTTEPIQRPAVICHVCNDVGGWGRGFVLSLSAKYPEAEQAYRAWFENPGKSFKLKTNTAMQTPWTHELGKCQIVQVKPDIWVANIIGQHGTQYVGKVPPIRYDALEEGLKSANIFASGLGKSLSQKEMTLHMPRLGAVLAGGEWPEIERIIKKTMLVESYVYTLPNQAWKWKDKYENPEKSQEGNLVGA